MTDGLEISLDGPAVSSPYIDLTLDIMKKFGVEACRIHSTLYKVPGQQAYCPGQFFVEPDLSNAGYFWAIGAITGKMISVKNISKNSLQGDLKQVKILEQMGCTINIGENEIGVRGSELIGIDVDMSDTPDAVPAIAVVASFAKGRTRINNIKHLREKECDRIDAISSQLLKMGITVRQGDDFLEILGGSPKGAKIETFNDHRIAMAFAVESYPLFYLAIPLGIVAFTGHPFGIFTWFWYNPFLLTSSFTKTILVWILKPTAPALNLDFSADYQPELIFKEQTLYRR